MKIKFLEFQKIFKILIFIVINLNFNINTYAQFTEDEINPSCKSISSEKDFKNLSIFKNVEIYYNESKLQKKIVVKHKELDTSQSNSLYLSGQLKKKSNWSITKVKFKDRICKAKGAMGCAVISDTRVIHRGSFEKGKKINRYSFWFQIDSNANEAERLLLNPEFLPKDISRELSEYLGFSKNFGLKVHPVTTNIDKIIPHNERLKILYKYFILTLLIPLNWMRLKTLETT